MEQLDDFNDDKNYIRAQKRVYKIKEFYKHLSVYLIINFIFIGRRIYKDIDYGDTLLDAFTDLSNYRFFFWWGVGLVIHGIVVLGTPNIFNKNWEERKVKEYMYKN
jgi:hypothetical protein